MKSFAKITMDSLKKYTGTVQQIVDYSSAASDAMSDFENLISSIDVEIKSLEEKKDQLNDAETVIEDKITGYEAKIEETQTRIDDLEDDLDRIQSELADTDEYISYDDSEEDWLEQENDDYISLKSQESAVERDLSKAENELDDLEQRLDRCRSVNKELSTVLSAVESRITNLSNNKTRVEKNKNEYNSAVVSIRNHSTHAASKLSMIERSLINYMGVRLNISSAFDTANREVASRNLNDLSYLTPKFKNTLSRNNETGKNYFDDEGKLYKNTEGLVANSTFKINSYTFTTDSLGRPVGASGKLNLAKEKKDRDWDSTLSEMGQGDERTGDNRGHIIGHQFDGPDSMVNAFPQDENINKGEYKAFENYLASELRDGKEVFISISPIYSNDSRRPIGVAISYSIDGVRRMRYFDNESKEGE